MTPNNTKRISKFLSLILRHSPETINLKLDKNGWANVSDILSNKKLRFSIEELKEVVANNDKQRFSFNEDNTKIRANQGHSIRSVELDLEPQSPPPFLYHGTVHKFMVDIKKNGLQKMNRNHVHLSKDRETATSVGNRRGKAIILSIRAQDMEKEGFKFFLSENKVWLTDLVPPKFINFK